MKGGSNVRGSAATAAIAEVTSHFGFESGGDNDVLTRNKTLRNKLLKGKAFMYKVRYVWAFSASLGDAFFFNLLGYWCQNSNKVWPKWDHVEAD